jgi:GNAT superfamily N-acetyltransferase
VFRGFKDVLKQSVDLERSWYRYKEQQIRAVVAEWYQSERELRGLLQLGPEPEERPEDVTAEFSVIVAAGEHLSQVRAIDRDALMEEEALTSADPDAYAAFRAQPLEQGAEQVLVAITAAEEVAAMVWARNTASGWELVQLAVRPPYRGLGLAERLLKELRGRARASGVDRITAQLDGGAVALSEYFGRRHFEPASIRMELAVQA